MSHSYRDAKRREQHFHKHREGRLLMPNRCHTGLLFTVNPRQEPKAAREAQLFLSTLTRDLEQQQQQATAAEMAERKSTTEQTITNENAQDITKVETIGQQSTSALLAAELAEATASCPSRSHKRPRDTNTNTDASTNTIERENVEERSSQWGSVLETNCKGYLFLNIPAIEPEKSCYPVMSTVNNPHTNGAKTVESNEMNDGEVSISSTREQHSHLITRINPLVAILVKRIFDDLRHNPRPVFRHCFRLFPVELTCCPTLPVMQLALRALLDAHFPVVSANKDTNESKTDDSALDFTRPLPMSLSSDDNNTNSNSASRSMHTIALQFVVKNNSNVELKKALWQNALQAVIPVNRFILVPPHRIQSAKHTTNLTTSTDTTNNNSNSKLVQAEAMVCITVLHATCCMGLQRDYARRMDYNVHAMSEAALDLTSKVTNETLFDVARVALAQLRVVQQASTYNGLLSVTSDAVRAAEEDMAQLGEVQEICASLEEKLALYDYPEARITVMSSSDNIMLTSSSDNRECNAQGQDQQEKHIRVCCTSTSPLLRTLAWLAHTQRPNTTTITTIPLSSTSNAAQVEGTNTTFNPEVSYTLDTECRALWSFPDTVANAIFAASSSTTSSSSTMYDNNPLALVQQDTSRKQSTQPSLDTLRGFSFSSELYYNRLADALWVFALTTPTEINEESAINGQGECYQVKDGRAVVYAMLRSGVARGFSHVLQQRLTLALRSIQCSISHDSTRYEKACVMNILLGIMAGAGQTSRAAGFHLQHKSHAGQDMNIHALTRHWRLSTCWTEWLRYFCTLTMKSKLVGVGQRSWTRVMYDVLFELLHGNAACTAARALGRARTCSTEEGEVDVVAPATTTISTMDIEAQSAESLLAQRLCYGICVELTTRQATPRPLLRFIFADLLHTTSTLCNSPAVNDAGGDTTTNTSNMSDECVAEAAMQAVFDAWGSAVCVQKGDLALNETLQHAVLYVMRWLIAHKTRETSTNEGEKAQQAGKDVKSEKQQRSSHFPSKWLGALLSGITRRLESVRTEPLRRAGLCVAAGFALYFVDAAETVQILLQDPQYASALTDWLAEEETEEENERGGYGASEALRLRRGGRKDMKALTSTSSPLQMNTAAAGGMSKVNGISLPVRRVVAYGLVQRYPLDPDEPVAYFVSEQQQEDDQEGDGHCERVVNKQITTGGAAGAIRGRGEVAQLRQHSATLTTTSSTPFSDHVVPGSLRVARVQDLPSFGLRCLPGERPTVTNYVDPTTQSTNDTGKEEGGGKVKSEAVDDEDAILYMSDSPQTPAPRSLRGSYELLAGIGRNAQAQLYEVQSDQERGLRGLLWCLRRHLRLTQQIAISISSKRNNTSTSSAATVRATSDNEPSPSLLVTLNELGPMLPTLLPVLMGLAFHAPEAERALLLQYRNEALELIIVATPTLALAQLAKMIYNTRYGIYERVAMIDAIGHAAHRLATLTSTLTSAVSSAGNTRESNAARVVPRRIYPPIGPVTTTTTSLDPTNSTILSSGVGRSATTTRRAIVVNEGRRGQTRRWGYAVPGRANSLSSQPLLFCNALGPYALTFCAVLIARVDKEEHYQFFQLDDPYTPAAVLRALWYVLDGVRLVRHIAPQLCSEVLSFVSVVATQHPHEAIKQLAWVSCGEVMRCWCGAVPLYSPRHTTTTTTTTTTTNSNSDDGGSLQRTPISEAYKGYDGSHSLMFSEEWLTAFASLERCAATLLNTSSDSSTSKSSSESTCEMALVVMCDLRELVEGTREAAWMAEHNAAHTIEIM